MSARASWPDEAPTQPADTAAVFRVHEAAAKIERLAWLCDEALDVHPDPDSILFARDSLAKIAALAAELRQ